MGSHYDVIVVGAGAVGSAAAYHAAKAGQRVLLLEQFEIDHVRGSSHGASRITRTSYHDLGYARLAMEAQREEWPRLERAAGRPLVTPTPGLFFGPADGSVRAYADAVAAAGAPVDRIDVAQARRRFPQFRFEWHAHTRKVYLVRLGRTPLIGEILAENAETHGHA